MPLPPEERNDLPAVDKLRLSIETIKQKQKLPTAAQQAAWHSIVQRGDSIWDEGMDAAIAEYQRQRPKRARYWRVVNDPQLLLQSMPENVDRATMKQMLVPLWATVHPEDAAHKTVDCCVIFLSSWFSDGVRIYFRDGKVTEVVPTGWLNRTMPWIEHAPFGTLRRQPGKSAPWYGKIQLEPFKSFAAIAADRSKWDGRHGRNDHAISDLPWDVALGQALLSVYAPPDVLPSDRQTSTLREFLSDVDKNSNVIIEALFKCYRRLAFIQRNKGPIPEDLFPPLTDPSGLRDLTELIELYVFPDTGESIALGFQFRGTWTGKEEIGLRWRDGKIEDFGEANVADPDRYGKTRWS